MKRINLLIIIGLCIHVSLTITFWVEAHSMLILWTCVPFLMLNIIGLLFIIANTQKLGCILFSIGCIPFFPIGLIGIFGARKLLNTIKEEKFLKHLDQ